MELKKIKHKWIKGNYFVSSEGKVYDEKGNELKTFIDVRGYEQVMIEDLPHSIDYLVMLTFEPFTNCILIRHKDNNLLNNNWDNLEWYFSGTEEENREIKQIKIADIKEKREINKTRKVIEYDFNGNILNQWNNIRDCQRATQISYYNIYSSCINKSNCANDRFFRFEDVPFKLKLKGSKVSRKVYKIDSNGNLIEEYNNKKECAEKNNIRLSNMTTILTPSSILNGRNKNNGYYYSYDKDYKPTIKNKNEIITQEEIKPIEPITEPKEVMNEEPTEIIIEKPIEIINPIEEEIKEKNNKINKLNMFDKIKRFIKALFKSYKKKDNKEITSIKINNDGRYKYDKIYQFDLNGNLVKEYNSTKECYQENNIAKYTFYPIMRRKQSQHGYYYSPDKDFKINSNKKMPKPILVIDKETNKVIREISSIQKTMKELHLSYSAFKTLINGGRNKKDYILKYKEE